MIETLEARCMMSMSVTVGTTSTLAYVEPQVSALDPSQTPSQRAQLTSNLQKGFNDAATAIIQKIG